jgi:hypothetical protein
MYNGELYNRKQMQQQSAFRSLHVLVFHYVTILFEIMDKISLTVL